MARTLASTTLAAARRELAAHADPEQAGFCLRWFRTGPGEYGEGDRYLRGEV